MTELEVLKILKDKQQAARQAVRLDRNLWKGCRLCNRKYRLWYLTEFCPNCGKPLTEEAWAELERRIGGAQDA